MMIRRPAVNAAQISVYSFRLYSSQASARDLERCRLWLSQLSPNSLPVDKFEVSFARSSGPGGQNVNKVNSKATIRMDREAWDNSTWIPEYLKRQLDHGNFRYLTKKGGLIVQSDKTRSRHENIQDCYEKLCRAIHDAVYVESETDQNDVRKWEEIGKKTNEKRLERKKQVSQKKEGRRKAFDDAF